MIKPVQFAIVGCGMISSFHVQAINAQEDARLAGIFDHIPTMAAKKATEYQTTCYASYESMLNDPSIDAISICTPSGMHAQQAIQAILAGKHVLIEKPIALNLEDSDQISLLARQNGVLVGVISQLRFSKAVSQIKAALDEGHLGQIVSVDLYMKYHRPQSYYDQSPWRGTWAMDGGGALMNQGIHGIDLLRYLAGPLQSIFASAKTLVRQIEVEDTLSAVVTFRSGALGVIQATTSVYPGFPRRLEIHGEKGSIILEEDTIIQWTIAGELERLCPQQSTNQKSHRNPTDIDKAGHMAQYENFIQAVQGNVSLLVDDQAGRQALEIIVKAYESSEKGQPLYFSPESAG
ncbi:MAG: Gfo/Idh/MocA family oxidoreductase [Bacillota bacterium]|nr:Gfo/Idh/MocA family oxidoreductase [Bacillota bacterium]